MRQSYPPRGYSNQPPPPVLPRKEATGAPPGPQPYSPQYYGDTGAQAAVAAGGRGGAAVAMDTSDQAVMGEPLYGDTNCQDLKRFKVAGYNDVWAAVLFIIQFLAAIIVGAINLADGKLKTTSSGSALTDEFVKGSAIGFGVSIGLTILLLLAIKAAPRSFIWVANVLFIGVLIALAVLGFIAGSQSTGVIFIILAAISCLWIWCVRNHIPFSSLLLEHSVNCVMKWWGTMVFAFIALILCICYYVMWVAMAVPTLNDINAGKSNASDGAVWLTLVFLLMFFWTVVTFQNVVHVTTSGTVATFFFVGDDHERDMPPDPTQAAFKRAMTTSFGSICFGSLVVAILKVIEYVARSAASNNRNSACACIAACLISCITRMMEYFNTYAFSHIAIYGCSYIEAAKLTWDFMMHSLFSALINDILIERVFFIVTLCEALLVGVVVYFALDKSWVACVAAVLITIAVANIMFNTVASGVVTLMVCVSEEPAVLNAKHGRFSIELNQAMREMRRGGCCGGGDDDG